MIGRDRRLKQPPATVRFRQTPLPASWAPPRLEASASGFVLSALPYKSICASQLACPQHPENQAAVHEECSRRERNQGASSLVILRIAFPSFAQ